MNTAGDSSSKGCLLLPIRYFPKPFFFNGEWFAERMIYNLLPCPMHIIQLQSYCTLTLSATQIGIAKIFRQRRTGERRREGGPLLESASLFACVHACIDHYSIDPLQRNASINSFLSSRLDQACTFRAPELSSLASSLAPSLSSPTHSCRILAQSAESATSGVGCV